MLRRLLLLLLWTGATLAAPETMVGRAGYEFLTADVDTHAVTRYNRDGQPIWVYDKVQAIDAWLLPGGDVWIAYLPSGLTGGKGGVRRVAADKSTRFDLPLADELMSCQPLPDGHLLIAECDAGRITEIDGDGKRLKSFELVAKGLGHRTVRQIRLTPQGTILACECYSNILREYDREGKKLAEWKLPMAYCAYRLANGNTLISGYRPAHLVEVDPAGKVVWELTPKDLPADLNLAQFGEAVRLANGHTVVSCCSRGVKGARAVAFEVTADKQVVWQLRESERSRETTALKPLGEEPR